MPHCPHILRPLLLGLACLLGWLRPGLGLANDLLVVQSSPSEVYAEAATAFSEVIAAGISLPGVASVRQTQVLVLGADPQGDVQEVAERVRTERPELILALGSRALGAVRGQERPVVYALVPAPDAIVGDRPQISGVRMAVDPRVQLAAIRRILPERQRIGLLHHPAGGQELYALSQGAGKELGLTIIGLAAENDRQAAALVQQRAAEFDLLILPPEPALLSPLLFETLALLSLERRLPVTAFAPKYLEQGAALAVFSTPEQQGRQAAALAKRLLQSPTIQLQPEYAKEIEVQTNPRILHKLGIGLASNGDR